MSIKKLYGSALVLGSFLLAMPFSAHAWLNYPVIGNWDMDGDGISERVFDTGSKIIIEKSTGKKYEYSRPSGGYYRVFADDLDGNAGAELTFTNYAGSKVDVLKMAVGYTTYSLGNLPYIYFADLDGVTGKEIICLSSAGTFKVITHKTKKINNYSTPTGGYSQVKFSDTDGNAGQEVILWDNLHYQVKIVRHRDGTNKTYGLSKGWYAMTITNQDGVVGNELVFSPYTTSGTKLVVNDRRKTTYNIN